MARKQELVYRPKPQKRRGRGGGRSLVLVGRMMQMMMAMMAQSHQMSMQLFQAIDASNRRTEGLMSAFLNQQQQPKQLGYHGGPGFWTWLLMLPGACWNGIRLLVVLVPVGFLVLLYVGTPKPPPPPPPKQPAHVRLLDRLDAAEAQFDSLAARIAMTPGMRSITIDRARFAMWKEMLSKPHSAQLEESVEEELGVFLKRLATAESNYQLFTGRFR